MRGVVTEEPLSALDEYAEIPSKHPGPAAWPFDMSRWGVLTARIGGRRVGGAVVAFDTPGVTMLEGRSDLAVLWDVRVAPDVRRRGVGTALFRAAERWAIARGCRQLKIETQETNVAACRLYEREGCVLRERHPQGDEVQLLWYKDLR
jgi:GNAT superfamily N-acetyltransferase